ncbi:MAG TPA: PUA domain-containing protein, partial [Lysobacter sp.]
LPGGVVSIDGEFRRGDVIEIAADGEAVFARGLAQYGSSEIRRIARRHSNEIEGILGFRYGESVVHRDDLVLLDTIGHKEATP